jgi:hypothetical protein
LAGSQRVIEDITISAGRTLKRGRNETQAWITAPGEAARLLSSAESAAFQQETTFLLRPDEINFSGFADRASFGNQNAFRVKTAPDAEFYFDTDTGLFQGAIWKAAERARMTNSLMAYESFDGLIAPRRIVRANNDSEQIFLVHNVRIRDLPLRVFDPPPELNAVQ